MFNLKKYQGLVDVIYILMNGFLYFACSMPCHVTILELLTDFSIVFHDFSLVLL